ncbi:MAG: ATP-binding protein [Thiobacillaceae bacterium]
MPGVLAELVQACSRNGAGLGDFAPFFLHDPTLALRLLTSAPIPAPSPSNPELIKPALACYTVNQIRAFALSLLPACQELLPSLQDCWTLSIRVALFARMIAEKTMVCPAEWAWLAGLFHNLGDWLRIHGLGEDTAHVCLDKIDSCGFIADGARYCRAPLTRVRTAHPLVKVLHAAQMLASREQGVDSMEVRAALSDLGIAGPEAAFLVSSVSVQFNGLAARYGMASAADTGGYGVNAGSMAQLIRAYSRFAAIGVFQQALPSGVSPQRLGKSLTEMLPLVFGLSRVVIFIVDRKSEALQLMADDSLPLGLQELTFPLDDPMGCLALAAQGQAVRWTRNEADRYAVLDEQLARLLQADTILYQPLGTEGKVEAVLALANPAYRMEEEPLWQTLVASVTAGFRPTEAPAIAEPQIVIAPESISRDQVRRAVHEVANPLTIMRNYVNLLSSKLESDVASQRDLKIIGDEIERASRILRGLSSGSVEQDSIAVDEETSSLAVNPVISELVRMSLGTLFVPNRISVQIDLDPDIPQIPTNRDKLKQVLLNLAKNAVEAMPRGGRLIFATRMRSDMMPPRLEIAVRDNGPGLPDAVLEHLFEPVDSTKGNDHSGLGLSISRNVVKSLGGEIECDTGQNGTEFRVFLPVTHTAQANLKIAG